MAIHKMNNPKVDLSGEEIKSTEEEHEEATLDLSKEKIEIPKPKGAPLNLRGEETEKPAPTGERSDLRIKRDESVEKRPRRTRLEKVASVTEVKKPERVLERAKSEHRQSFEDRLKRLDNLERKKAEAIKQVVQLPESKDKESLEEYINSEEAKIKEQIMKLSERLSHLEALQRGGKVKRKTRMAKTVESKKIEGVEEEAQVKEMAEASENKEPVEVATEVKGIKKKKYFNQRYERPKKTYRFPDGFLWGTSSSAYQIEGGITNNWSMWERSPHLHRKLRKLGKNPGDYICGHACDSYNRYGEDLDLALKLNNNAIRFGIEWSRIQPKRDTWDTEAINHYREVLAAAKKRKLKTIVTLWHWTIPAWLARDGGWDSKQVVDYFLKFVDLVIKELGADIDYWITLNEPMALIGMGYMRGDHPPGKRYNFFPAGRVQKNLVSAHNQAYDKIHDHFSNARVSLAMITDYFEPLIKWDPLHIAVSKVAKYFHHGRFYNKIKERMDFIGLNYYFHNRVSYIPPFKFNKNERVNEMGWELYPRGIYMVLKYLNKFNKPIIITENGIADADDDQRPTFIKNHLRYIHKAIEEGVDVRGYMHWSLLDNFEWAWGWTQKFGLYEMDRKTFERKARPSAKLYADICKNNRIEI